MAHNSAYKAAVLLLNTTLGLDDLPLEIHGRIATALILLDRQDEENIFEALQDAYAYIQKDNAELESRLERLEHESEDKHE